MTEPLEIPPATEQWKVLGDGIRREDALDPNGAGLVQRWVVPYKILSGPAKGHVNSVHIDPDDYTPAAVAAAIHDAVRTTSGVADLGNPGV